MTLYLLDHNRWIDEEYYDSKMIGVYSSYDLAKKTIEKYSFLPGFCDYKNDFRIEPREVLCSGKLDKNIKNNNVYLLIGVRFVDDDELAVSCDVYANRISAIVALFIKTTIKNKEKAEKFYIDRYLIDEDNWKEGFVVIED